MQNGNLALPPSMRNDGDGLQSIILAGQGL